MQRFAVIKKPTTARLNHCNHYEKTNGLSDCSNFSQNRVKENFYYNKPDNIVENMERKNIEKTTAITATTAKPPSNKAATTAVITATPAVITATTAAITATTAKPDKTNSTTNSSLEKQQHNKIGKDITIR